MKKIIIPILLLLPMMSQAQNTLTEQQQLEQAQKQMEAAQKALEAAKMRATAARLKAQADSIEKASAQMEKQAEEAEKTQPSLPTEEKVATSGWSVPTATIKKAETKKTIKTANGVELKADPKYLGGAIVVNNEGRIEFTLDTDANGKTADEIYKIVYNYMSDLTQGKNNIASRMALINKDEHIIANTMDEWLVFNSSFLSLDRSEFRYNLVAKISDNHLQVTLSRMTYNYEEGRSTGFKEPAERIIIDKVALNKKKNDLAKIFGKFRKFTIDRKDEIFNELKTLVKQ